MSSNLQGPDHLATIPPPPSSPSSPLIRPQKRRRFYRKRIDSEDEDLSDLPPPSTIGTPELQTVDELISHNGAAQSHDTHIQEEAPPIAELVRQRKVTQRRRGGIEFTNLHPSTSAPGTAISDRARITKEDETSAEVKSVIERFAPQTGQISETSDKHMYVPPP